MADKNRRRSYQTSFAAHGNSPKALQWKNYKAAAIRYRELVKLVYLEGKSILDAGCGMGDLLPYIYASAKQFSYLGVDITPEFIDLAKERYLGHQFRVANPFIGDVTNTFDIVISSGTLNANGQDWLKKRQAMIKSLFELCTEALVFNMAGSLAPKTNNGRIAYANAEDIASYCKTLASKVILITDYHPKDFTVAMFK